MDPTSSPGDSVVLFDADFRETLRRIVREAARDGLLEERGHIAQESAQLVVEILKGLQGDGAATRSQSQLSWLNAVRSPVSSFTPQQEGQEPQKQDPVVATLRTPDTCSAWARQTSDPTADRELKEQLPEAVLFPGTPQDSPGKKLTKKARTAGLCALDSVKDAITTTPRDQWRRSPLSATTIGAIGAAKLESLEMNMKSYTVSQYEREQASDEDGADAEFEDGNSDGEVEGKLFIGASPTTVVPIASESSSVIGTSSTFKVKKSFNLWFTKNEVPEERPSGAGGCIVAVRRLASKLVRHQFFHIGVGIVVFLNASVIGVQVDYASRGEEPQFFKVMGWLFCATFAMELLARIATYGWSFWRGSGWHWNYFDFVIVVLNVAEEIAAVFVNARFEHAANVTLLRFVRILKLLRVFRLMRILRLVRELNIMVSAVISSARSFMWTVVLMLMMFYICGVFLTQLVTDHKEGTNGMGYADEDWSLNAERLEKYYGSLGNSVLSLFQAMTGGVDWNDLLDPLRTNVSPWLAYAFSLYIAFSVLVMLNLVTGIFVESAQASIREHRDLDLVNRVRELFYLSDQDKSGKITWEEFRSHIKNPLMEEYFKAVDLDRSEARGLWQLLDASDSGSITASDFVNGCLRLRGNARSMDMNVMMFNMRSKFHTLSAQLGRLESALEAMEPGHFGNTPLAHQG